MQVTESYGNLGGIEFDSRFIQSALFSQIAEELSTWHILHDEIDSVRSLEHIVHGYYERIIDLKED